MFVKCASDTAGLLGKENESFPDCKNKWVPSSLRSRTRERLRKAGTMAREALSLSQKKMKRCVLIRKAVLRNFLPGEKVLVLIPIPGSALTARFSGSYMIKSKYEHC